jgi:hypothetical protein
MCRACSTFSRSVTSWSNRMVTGAPTPTTAPSVGCMLSVSRFASGTPLTAKVSVRVCSAPSVSEATTVTAYDAPGVSAAALCQLLPSSPTWPSTGSPPSGATSTVSMVPWGTVNASGWPNATSSVMPSRRSDARCVLGPSACAVAPSPEPPPSPSSEPLHEVSSTAALRTSTARRIVRRRRITPLSAYVALIHEAQLVPSSGTVPASRYASTASSMQSLPAR